MTATNLPGQSAVVLVIDRLGAGWLGPYGNTWLDTPNFNRLAARSVLCATTIADSPDLTSTCRDYWTGRHALEPNDSVRLGLPDFAALQHVHSLLISDDPDVVQHPLASRFGERRLVPETGRATPAETVEQAETIEQTGLFALFEAANAALERQTEPFLLWLHSRGMSGPWDAPLELRYQFADEEDPDPPSFVEPPNVMLPEDFDPDTLLGISHAYAGQVALADMCLGLLLNRLDEHPQCHQTLLVVTSPRGYPLGEHRRVGPCDEALYGEQLHVPLLVRFPQQSHALTRSNQIVQPHEVCSLVAEVCGWQPESQKRASALLRELQGEPLDAANVACAIGRNQRAIRTPAWFLRESQSDEGPQREGPQRELFAKPDDRWEANEVSSRCGDVAELLAEELDRFEAAARAGRLSEIPPLAELLYDIWH